MCDFFTDWSQFKRKFVKKGSGKHPQIATAKVFKSPSVIKCAFACESIWGCSGFNYNSTGNTCHVLENVIPLDVRLLEGDRNMAYFEMRKSADW